MMIGIICIICTIIIIIIVVAVSVSSSDSDAAKPDKSITEEAGIG